MPTPEFLWTFLSCWWWVCAGFIVGYWARSGEPSPVELKKPRRSMYHVIHPPIERSQPMPRHVVPSELTHDDMFEARKVANEITRKAVKESGEVDTGFDLTPRHPHSLLYVDRRHPYVVCCCRDGTISYYRRGERGPFSNVALPVGSVESRWEFEQLVTATCSLQRQSHPEMPGKPWYTIASGPFPFGFEGDIDDLVLVAEHFAIVLNKIRDYPGDEE